MDRVKLHSRGNDRQHKQIYGCLKGFRACEIHAHVTIVIQKIIYSSNMISDVVFDFEKIVIYTVIGISFCMICTVCDSP